MLIHKKYIKNLILLSFILLSTNFKSNNLPRGFVYLSDIDPSIIQEIRYATKFNFVGRPINGYNKGICILTKEAAIALSKVQSELKKKYGNHYSLKVYDGYRPQKAVEDFWNWANDSSDIKMKKLFYPDCKNKKELFNGYIARKSGHSRGSTVDLTIVDTSKKTKLDEKNFEDNSINMGTIFDFLGELANTFSPKISNDAVINRKMLRELMINNGFEPYDKEWWHFTLKNEPFKNEYFDFDVS